MRRFWSETALVIVRLKVFVDFFDWVIPCICHDGRYLSSAWARPNAFCPCLSYEQEDATSAGAAPCPGQHPGIFWKLPPRDGTPALLIAVLSDLCLNAKICSYHYNLGWLDLESRKGDLAVIIWVAYKHKT